MFIIAYRVWTYFITQSVSGVFFLIMGLSSDNLGVTIAMLILGSFFMHMVGSLYCVHVPLLYSCACSILSLCALSAPLLSSATCNVLSLRSCGVVLFVEVLWCFVPIGVWESAKLVYL